MYIAAAERRLRVVQLRKEGLLLTEIKDRLGVSIGTVYRDIAICQANLRKVTTEIADEMRAADAEAIAEDLARTECDFHKLEARMRVLERKGRDDDGELSLDPAFIKSFALLVRARTELLAKRTELRARRAKMFGYDAPDKTEVAGSISLSDITSIMTTVQLNADDSDAEGAHKGPTH